MSTESTRRNSQNMKTNHHGTVILENLYGKEIFEKVKLMESLRKQRLLEVCVESIESALNACKGGARRLEVCSSLHTGGLTPSLGLFTVIKKFVPSDIKLFVMIRTRPGNFIYSSTELQIMLKDIKYFKEKKADGFVFGCLTNEQSIDETACKKLLKAAGGLPCTFHRAFDSVKNPEQTLEILTNLGFTRLLTSGQNETAYLGRDLIKRYIEKVNEMGSSLIVMPGGGVRPGNLKEILETTKCKEIHSSAREEDAASDQNGWISRTSIVLEIIEIANGTKFG